MLCLLRPPLAIANILEIQARKFTVLIYTIQLISSLKYEAMPFAKRLQELADYDARTQERAVGKTRYRCRLTPLHLHSSNQHYTNPEDRYIFEKLKHTCKSNFNYSIMVCQCG